jgi:hypothetical protein
VYEWGILAFNIGTIGFIIWLLRRKIGTKLNAVEERQKRLIEKEKTARTPYNENGNL